MRLDTRRAFVYTVLFLAGSIRTHSLDIRDGRMTAAAGTRTPLVGGRAYT